MSRHLIANVLMRGDDHEVIVLPAGTEVPDEYAELLISDHLFAPEESAAEVDSEEKTKTPKRRTAAK